jgi:hypothetical protein
MAARLHIKNDSQMNISEQPNAGKRGSERRIEAFICGFSAVIQNDYVCQTYDGCKI